MFGENFTSKDLMETQVNIGDVFQLDLKVIVTQPRMGCYKLGFRFGRMDIIKKFLASGCPGIYFRVSEEGEVEAGDSIDPINRDRNLVTVARLSDCI
jgi:MOSC domain-containing protein YiiM